MGKYRAYPEYKDSGIDWLGEVPSHWVVSSLRFLIDSIRNGSTSTQVEQSNLTVPISRIESISTGEINSDKVGFVNERTIDRSYQLNQGDILMSHINSLAMVGNLAIKRDNSVLYHGMNLLRLTPNLSRVSSGYLYWLLKSGYSRQSIESLAKPAINQASVSTESLKSLRLLLPDSSEQTQIANFLDHETAKIDTLIEKQQQLIKLLKEKRQAVISHAVTKGLNPQAPMKDSGVEWCDYIPEHWRIGKLGYFARVGNGATPSRENQSFWNDGTVGWLNSSKVNDVIITEAEQFITPLALAQTSVQPVTANDLVIAITGEGQTRGRVAICQLEATINQHLASIRIYDDSLHHEFLFLWLSANYERIRFESTGAGSTKGAITCGDIKSYPIVIAPLSEQTEIINHIKSQNQHFSNLMAKADNQVQLLKERRTALISAAVTGKIDVRNWQAPSTSITKIPEGEV